MLDFDRRKLDVGEGRALWLTDAALALQNGRELSRDNLGCLPLLRRWYQVYKIPGCTTSPRPVFSSSNATSSLSPD